MTMRVISDFLLDVTCSAPPRSLHDGGSGVRRDEGAARPGAEFASQGGDVRTRGEELSINPELISVQRL